MADLLTDLLEDIAAAGCSHTIPGGDGFRWAWEAYSRSSLFFSRWISSLASLSDLLSHQVSAPVPSDSVVEWIRSIWSMPYSEIDVGLRLTLGQG